jgi:hypothetical protein
LVGLAGAHRHLGEIGPAISCYARAHRILSPLVKACHPTLVAARDGLTSLQAEPAKHG